MKTPLYHREYKEEQLKTRTLDRTILYRLLQYFSPYRWWIGCAILALLIGKGIEVSVPLFLGHFVDTILSDTNLLFSSLATSIFLLILFMFVGYAFDAITVYIKSWIGQKALYRLRNQIYRHLQFVPLSFFHQTPVGRLISRTIHDVDKISQMFTESLVPLLGNIFLFIGIGVGIFAMDPRVGAILLCIVPVTWMLVHYFRISVRKTYSLVRAILSAMNVFVQEYIMGAHIIRHFGLRKKEKREFDAINEDYRTANSEISFYYSLFFSGIDVLQACTLIILFIVLVLLTPEGTPFPAGTFFTYSLYGLLFFRPLWDLAERYNVLQLANASAERVFAILDEDLEPKDSLHAQHLHAIETILFDDVWFAYEGENWILRGLHLKLEAGESIALVGMTGAGKTTIMKLLLRFYDVQKGHILINGKDIRRYTRASVRAQFSVVLQDPVIFSDTLEANISLYHPHIGRDEIENTVHYLHMETLINKLPQGLEQPLSEKGSLLSLGEQQLVSLARAVAHNRNVFILDEATANIDTKTEHLIQQALAKILPHKTALVIAHRLSTIKDVDRIAVLHEGIVIETGSHAALLEKKGFYEKLYRYQFNP